MNITDIGSFIKTNRKRFKITQKDLAKTLGVHWITVCRWETNTIIPSKQNLIILENVFGKRKDNLKIPTIKFKNKRPVLEFKLIKPFKEKKETVTSDKIRKGIIANYKKGISIDNLAKFYNLKENTVTKILKKHDVINKIDYTKEYGKTSTQIAKVLGISHQRVSQLARKNKLINKLTNEILAT